MERILVIDDELPILRLLQKIFKEEGYEASVLSSSEHALNLLSQETVDLILVDLNMPKVGGIELLKQVRLSYPQTEIIIFTGQATVETAIESLRNGAYDYIIKPFDIDELLKIVKNCLEHNRLRRQEGVFRETTNLYQLAQEATKNHTEKSLLEFILKRTLKTLKADAGSVYMFVPQKEELVPVAFCGQEHTIEDQVKVGEKVIGWVAQQCRPLLIQEGFVNQPQFKNLQVRHEIVSSMICPLINQQVLMGIICVNRFSNRTNYQFTKHDLDSLQIFALHATLIIAALRHNQALKQLDEMKSDFVANVSHELRTPLMAISGAIELLSSPNSVIMADDKAKVFLDLINRNTDRMCRLVNDLLDFSRMETKQLKLLMTRFDMKQIIDETIQEFAFRAKEKNISLNADFASTETFIVADRERMKQVVTNLVNNALKFTPGGSIKVSYQLLDKQDFLLTVTDTGIGIPKDKLEKIFDKFYQVDGSASRSHSGFGLGLAIVKSIVDAHNGKIWAESEMNKGTTFFVKMPCISSKPPSN